MDTTKAHLQIKNMTWADNTDVRHLATILNSPHSSMTEKVLEWYRTIGIKVPSKPTLLSPSSTTHRLDILLRKIAYLTESSGSQIIINPNPEENSLVLSTEFTKTKEPNLEEISKHLADLLVIVISHAIEYGLPINTLFSEVMYSNGTRLPENGIPIINQCTIRGKDGHACEDDSAKCELTDPTAPLGHILKPDTYIEPNISSILEEASIYGTHSL